VLPAGCGGDDVSAPVPWRKPRKVLDWPDQPEEPCNNESDHLAHAWYITIHEEPLRVEDMYVARREMKFSSHYCKGAGRLRGYL
jgi:hypothetical protein